MRPLPFARAPRGSRQGRQLPLRTLPAALAPLSTRDGSIERAAFDAVFVETLCALDTLNRPASCP